MKYVLLFLTIFVGLSCSRHVVGDRDNSVSGEVYEKEIKQFRFKLYSINSDALVNMNYSANALEEHELESVKDQYSDFWCFKLEIDIKNFNNEITEYNGSTHDESDEQILRYYLFEMQKDLKLYCDNQEIPCTVYFFERSYAMTKTNRFIVGFPKPKKETNVLFSYDNKFLNTGKVNFLIKQNDFL